MNNIIKIKEMQDLYAKIFKNNKISIKDLPKRFVNKEIVEIAYENGVLELIDKDVLTKVINDDVELWDKIIEYDPYYIKLVPKEYITDDLLMKAYNYDNNLINFLLKTNYNIVTEEMLKNYKSKPLDEENADNIRKIIKEDSVYEILVDNHPENILILPKDRAELFTYNICHKIYNYDSDLFKCIPKNNIRDSIYIELFERFGTRFFNEFPEDNENIFTREKCLHVIADAIYCYFKFIPSKYITDEICKSSSLFCDYIISNKDKIDTESVCIDFVNNYDFDNSNCRMIRNHFKDILLLGKKYAGKAIDILIERHPLILTDTRIDERNDLDNNLYIKILKSIPWLIYHIPENKRTSEMYIIAFNDADDLSRIKFPNNRKDLVTDDFCIEYLKAKGSLSDIAEEYRTTKVCLYAYEQNRNNIIHFPKNNKEIFNEEICIDCFKYLNISMDIIPEDCITSKIVEKTFEEGSHIQLYHRILNDKCSKFITKDMCIKMANEYNDLRFIDYIDDELLSELYDVIIDKLTQK